MLFQSPELAQQIDNNETNLTREENFSIKDKLQEKFRGFDITNPKQQETITSFFDYITKETSNQYPNELIKYIDNLNSDDFDEISDFDEEERNEESLNIIGQLDDNSKQTTIDTYNEIDSKAEQIDSKAEQIDSKAEQKQSMIIEKETPSDQFWMPK